MGKIANFNKLLLFELWGPNYSTTFIQNPKIYEKISC